MVWVRVQRATPDGLDPVFEAYRCLKGIFEAAAVVEREDPGEGYYEVMLQLPGSGELVDPYDLNPLNGLEAWLASEVAGPIQGEAGDEE